MRLVLLGTAGGPRPSTTRSAPAQAIVHDGRVHVVDAGNGVARQLALAGIPRSDLAAVYITHHHADHMLDLGALPLIAWTDGRSEPIELAGLNRMWRQMIVDGIEADPAWAGGNYTQQPQEGLRLAESILVIAGAAPLNFQKLYPKRDAAVAYVRDRIAKGMAGLDANDLIYQVDSSRTYDPWPKLEAIKAPMTWINSADDFINPRNFSYPQEALKRMPNTRFRLIPETTETHGHGTHTWAVNWKADLADLLKRTE